MADSVEEVVYNYLTTDSAFMAKITGGVYWMDVEDSKPGANKPYIVFWLVDDPGIETRLNTSYQGEARIQFDLWDTNKIRGARLRTALREKVRELSESTGGYYVMTTGLTEQTLKRESKTDPYHYIVDLIIMILHKTPSRPCVGNPLPIFYSLPLLALIISINRPNSTPLENKVFTVSVSDRFSNTAII